MMSDDCIMKFSYSSDTIQVTQTYDLEVRGAYRLYTITPEHFDVTSRHFAIMSPVQCDDEADNYEMVYVLNPSLDVYQFSDDTWSCWELPATETGTFAWNLPRDDTDLSWTW